MTFLRWSLGCATVLLLLASFSRPIWAQAQPPLTCEQRSDILNQLVEDVSGSRRNSEIETAALRVRVNRLEAELKAAAQQAPDRSLTPATPPKGK